MKSLGKFSYSKKIYGLRKYIKEHLGGTILLYATRETLEKITSALSIINIRTKEGWETVKW